ncbi:YVTN family beta-propeller protein [Chryseobacterium sp. H1D6B]|uniref:YncE family protein n=1 Tax=Chryseobacterium sp. H1D6B TaxID=2940588 RepID=UPI0015CD9D93|nr:YncE family protein [Chryseobacterium sp. H1D6B]MDH6250665.1 YVTN family beta-propeller protein [Chryseobacterium sp. H1D6B]
MKNYFSVKPAKLITSALFLGLTFTTSCDNDNDGTSAKPLEEKVVVANRDSGTVSFINALTNTITKTLSIPNSEPMYIVYVPKTDKVYVGDRAGKKIHVINPQNQQIENSINVGNGVFHMWADGQGKELWVSNDIDNTVSVVNLASNTVTATINIGMKPHDVFLTQDGTTAFVSVIASDSSPDKVFQYSTSTYTKTGEASVGKDPHLFRLSNNRLYVPCQSGKLYVLDAATMNPILEKDYTGAHGIFPSPDQNTLFVTNITGGQLYSINTLTGSPANNPTASTNPAPHNIIVNQSGNKMFVTHSGADSNTISTYRVTPSGAVTALSTIKVGTNPFGLTYYKRKQN